MFHKLQNISPYIVEQSKSSSKIKKPILHKLSINGFLECCFTGVANLCFMFIFYKTPVYMCDICVYFFNCSKS